MTSREISLVLLSAFLHALWNFRTKGSRDPLAFAILLTACTASGALCVFPFVEWREIPSQLWWVVSVSATVHTLYFYCLSKGYQTGDLSLIYPIARSTPAFVPLVAVPLLGERLSLPGALGIAVVVAGIWLVHAEGWRWRSLTEPGTKFAFATLATTVAYSLLDKQGMAFLSDASWSSPVPRALIYFCVVETIVFALFLPLALREIGRVRLRRVARAELGTAAAAALASIASYTLILEAFRTASVSYVVAARQSSVLFALLLGGFFLRDRPSRPRLLGVAATVAGVALIAIA